MIGILKASRRSVSLIALVSATATYAQAGGGTAAPAGTPTVPNAPGAPVATATPNKAPLSSDVSPSGAGALGAGEIVVTANKREQNLNKVGLSITAIGSEQLAARRITNIADLAQATPGLTFAPTPTSTPVYTLRGVGFFDASLAGYPDVSIYIDQAPLSLPVMSTLTGFDLERVEVLKGPQGTLFGNNATGGAINFISAKPTTTARGGFEVGYGRFNELDASGFYSGPITDTLRARFAFKTVTSNEGWQKSYTRDDDLGKKNDYAGRFIVDWNPTSRLKFELNLNGWVNKDETPAPQKIASSPQNPIPANFPLTNYPNAPQNDRAADWGPYRPFANTRFWQSALRADYDLGFATLTSITNYSQTRVHTANEGGGTALSDDDLPSDKGFIKSFTQEVRLSNGGGHRFRWTLGGNYERTTVTENTAIYYADTSATLVNGFTNNTYFSDQRMRNYAGFANGEFDVTDKITLKGGVRRTRAERNLYAISHDDPNFPQVIDPFTGTLGLPAATFFNAVYGAIYGGAVATIEPGGNFILDNRTNADGSPVNPSTYLTTDPVRDRIRENSTSWSGGVDYKATSDLLFYLNVSRGFKAGSFPQLSGSIYTAYRPVKQEKLTDYEAGFKAQLFDRKVSITGAAFYYDYRDKQLLAKFVDPIFGALSLLVNVPKSTVKGGEFNIDARPIQGLTLSASGTYLDAKVRNYDGVTGSAVNVQGLRDPIISSFRGIRLPYAPKFQYQVRADYDRSLTGALNGFVGIGVNGQTSSISTLVLPGQSFFGVDSSLYKINARALVNANIGIHAASNAWRVTLYGKNIFNKYYWTSVVQAYDTVGRYAGRPAEYGISAAFKF